MSIFVNRLNSKINSMAKELNFTLEGVQGDLKLKYGPFNQRLYQDGREIKKQGRFNPKYYVINTGFFGM